MIEFLVDNDKSSKIFVIDKTPPEIAWLNEKHANVFKNPKVVFQSANLIATSKFFFLSHIYSDGGKLKRGQQ